MGTPRPVTAYLGLGSNLGDRHGHLQWALQRLSATPGVEVEQVSDLVESEPVGCPEGSPAFLNGAARIRTGLSPRALLEICQALERERGRDPDAPRNSPRPLDLDLLLYGDRRIDLRGLRVPHPRLHERPFARAPLQQLGADLAAVPTWNRPEVIEDAGDLSARVAGWEAGGCTVGLVPTMGSLHGGHLSLVQRARRECDRVVVSIFVNPLQFGAGEDFDAYPRDLGRDLQVLGREEVDAVFSPSATGMFGDGFCTRLAVGREAVGMEGAARPDHFTGVVTVVARLLAIARPHRAYFGRKDAQQLAVVRRMIEDLGFPVALVECPTCREPDGLALSSRNAYLGPADRAAATVLFASLRAARQAFRQGERDADALLRAARTVLAGEPRAQVEYLELRREGDLLPLPPGPVHGGRLLVAARFGEPPGRVARLIDNLSLTDPLEEV